MVQRFSSGLMLAQAHQNPQPSLGQAGRRANRPHLVKFRGSPKLGAGWCRRRLGSFVAQMAKKMSRWPVLCCRRELKCLVHVSGRHRRVGQRFARLRLPASDAGLENRSRRSRRSD